MNRFTKAVLITTLIAGTLDIIAAHVHWTINAGSFPDKMFLGIASGAVGRKTAFSGGAGMYLLGFFIHYFISFSFTLLFFLVYPAFAKVSYNKYINAAVYGLFVWLTMNFVVLPLTALPQGPFVFTLNKAIGLFILMAVFGLPISIMADRYYKRTNMSKQKTEVPQGQLI
jgi:uncharacterized membrane protein YagU involved in acid resistance